MEEDLPKIKKQAVAGGMAQVVRVPAWKEKADTERTVGKWCL
jgi:hypothetical protein